MRIVLIPVLVLALLGGACAAGDEQGADGRLDVVASFHPLAELARAVGGDAVRVTDLTPASAEPHDLELSTDDVDRIEDADLVVVLGGGFQPAVERVADRRDGPTLIVLDQVDVPDPLRGDPHLWLDPTRMAEIAELLAAELDRDATDLVGSLRELDAAVAAGLHGCARRDLVVAHRSFGWFAARYGLTQHGIAGIEPDREPDPRRLAELAELVQRRGVTTVFTEASVAPEVAETLAHEAKVRTGVLDTFETRPSDGAGYEAVMRRNLAALVEALGC